MENRIEILASCFITKAILETKSFLSQEEVETLRKINSYLEKKKIFYNKIKQLNKRGK